MGLQFLTYCIIFHTIFQDDHTAVLHELAVLGCSLFRDTLNTRNVIVREREEEAGLGLGYYQPGLMCCVSKCGTIGCTIVEGQTALAIGQLIVFALTCCCRSKV